MTDAPVNRRKLRTNELRPAIELLLKSVAKEFDLENAAVADHLGLFVGGYGDEALSKALAENAPLLVNTDASDVFDEAADESVDPSVQERLGTAAFSFGGEELTLLLVGRAGVPPEGAFDRAQTGVKRILEESQA